MSEHNDTPSSGTFMHAFLPGLILGLVVGAVAGALLPDLLGGSNIPTPDGSIVDSVPGERDGRRAEPEAPIDDELIPETDPETDTGALPDAP